MKRSIAAALLVAGALAVAFLRFPLLGTDLSAQVARADFFHAHGLTPIDLRWYGGTNQFGYSLVSPALMAWFGVRQVAVAALLVSAVAFAALLVRSGARRPLLGSVVGALCIAGNLASGRVTYAVGVAFGLLALLALTARSRAVRWPLAALGALLASATSPVAGLFVGLAGAAMLLAASHPPTRRVYAVDHGEVRDVSVLAERGRGARAWDGVVLGVACAVPLAANAWLFGEGGVMNISALDTLAAVLASLAVAALTAHRSVRYGALLSAAGVLAAYLFATPVGLNATRLATMFAIPALVATARRSPAMPRWVGGPLVVVTVLVVAALLPPVVVADLRDSGNPAAKKGYYAPLVVELRTLKAARVEIPPTRDYWESAYVEPLARGWLRQVDIERNPQFFPKISGTKLTAANYEAFLRANAVSHVAVADTELSWLAKEEAALVKTGLPYLTEVWHDGHWKVYAVTAPAPLVEGLVSADAVGVTFETKAAGDVDVRVRWSRWLTAAGATVRRAPDGWTVVRVPGPGRYTLTS